MANKQVKVRSLKRHTSLYPKQWASDQKDNMGTMHKHIDLIFPPETDAQGKPKGEEQKITVWANGQPATVGESNTLTVPPHISEWIRLVLAHYHSGTTTKGDGYAMSVVLNLPDYQEDTVKKLVDRGAVIESVFGDKNEKLYATFEQLFNLAVLHASTIQSTAARWPEEEKVVETAKVEDKPVEVSFTL